MTTLDHIQGWCPWCGDHMGWGAWGMGLGWLVLLIVVVALVWVVARTAGGDRRDDDAGSADRAEEVLRERYARGEIDEETYRRRLEELRRG